MRGDGRVYLRGKVYWVCYYLRGRQFREPARTEDPKVAERFLKNRLREVGADIIGAKKFTPPQNQRILIHDLLIALRADYELRGKLSPQNKSGLDRADKDFQGLANRLTSEQIDLYVQKRLAA